MRTPTQPSFTIEHALLGYVYERPSHGYEIYQQLAAANGLWQVWRIKQSQLYALLNKLEEAAYLTATLQEQAARPPRKVYTLTDSGRAAYQAWLCTPVTHGRYMRLEFLTKLYFASCQAPSTVRQLLDEQVHACQQWLVELQTQADIAPDAHFFGYAVQEFRRQQIESFLTWLTTCQHALVSGAE